MEMWETYFSKAKIFGFDNFLNPRTKPIVYNKFLSSNRIKIFEGDMGTREDLFKLTENQNYDIILEDGSHASNHTQICLGTLFPCLKSNGIYIIEDLFLDERPIYGYVNFDTYKILNNFETTKEVNFPLCSKEENEYLNKNIKSIQIKISPLENDLAIAIIEKK
jgi:demethylmacrocin O-methyltransferase